MNLWDQILARVEAKVNRHSFYTWFKPTSFVGEDRRDPRRPGSEYPVQGLADKTLFRRYQRGRSAKSTSASLAVNFVADAPAQPGAIALGPAEAQAFEQVQGRVAAGPRSCRPQSALHVRHVHRRSLEPVRPRRMPGCRRSAVALLQPAVHLRWRRAWQDAPHACRRPLRARRTTRA